MDTNALKKFAQSARNLLIEQVRSKLDLVLDPASPARREHPQAMKELDAAIARDGKAQVIEQVAYTWFNRFTALRFMDANGYTNVGVVSPADGQTRPEILAEAMAGNLPEGAPGSIAALLDGRTPSSDPQGEAYRQLLVHACNQWHGPMPFLFEELDDYTELLMPEDLLSQSSILTELRKVMTEDACRDVEIIGWLYQFYISEKKDQVFAGLKKNQKITAENIPAATQLFTPHWIVRYLVENSLGRLWLLNRPGSKLAERMDYYIAPEEPETDFLKIGKPEEIRVCDPACGSGHMLTYAFDLLYAIYEEEGYEATEIPALILSHNLHGVEIDDRAGALAAFALVMKAAAKLGRRRFLRLGVQPNICVMQDVRFTPAEMRDVAAVVGRDLFTAALRETLGQFEQAKNFGSLIVPKLRDPAEVARVVRQKDFSGDLLLRDVQERVLKVLEMAEALSPKYHVVVANPPYMGGKNMHGSLSDFLKMNFADGKSDLFSSFMIRNLSVCLRNGYLGIMTPNVWMYISSHERLRSYILSKSAITCLVELPLSGFKGATVQICAFNMMNSSSSNLKGNYFRLTGHRGGDNEMAEATRFAITNGTCPWAFKASANDFNRVPGSPIAYWINKRLREIFTGSLALKEVINPKQGTSTGDDETFVRFWTEIEFGKLGLGIESLESALSSSFLYFPLDKGGEFRRWYGNNEKVIKFGDGAYEKLLDMGNHLPSRDKYFLKGITWSKITSFKISVRSDDVGYVFSSVGLKGFPAEEDNNTSLAYMNSKLVERFTEIISPTLSIVSGDIEKLPYLKMGNCVVASNSSRLIFLGRSDWDAYETSWDFTTLPLLAPEHRDQTLAGSYAQLRAHWQSMTDEMQRLEEENNRIFIDAYGLQDELTPEVPLNEITLTCNPAYRYSIKNDAEANETRLRADTMAEFLSYAVGCMFGRYSLDAPGLILANQGETLADYLSRVPNPSFLPDEDNVIPVLDADWFPDDITERFRLFLRVTFGEAHFQENLRYIEDALGKDIRKYFTKDFYADHVKRYKKRPIYWMFSSPKGTFNALIYMHRYRPDTVSVLLNDYLREFISKLEGERGRLEKLSDDPSASQGQRTKALKDMAVLAKQIDELIDWERDVVFPLAQAKIEIDLDDGVKVNYPKFGAALKKIVGVS